MIRRTGAANLAREDTMAIQAKILIVDDDQDICQYMETMLEASGYEVRTISDPTTVVDAVRSSDYHILVIDLMMPQLGGIELIQQIRKVDTDVAIVVSTGYPSVDTAVDALKLNVSDYIRKPFDIEEFRDTIADVLRRKGISLNPEEELHRSIGATVRRIRKEQDLTLKQLARRTGLSVSLLSQIERAESSASVSSLYKIASGLGIKLTVLFGDF
jgi:two-component system, OmpR family, response regulator